MGAAPGGWTQVAARKVQADVNKPQYGLVLGVDILGTKTTRAIQINYSKLFFFPFRN